MRLFCNDGDAYCKAFPSFETAAKTIFSLFCNSEDKYCKATHCLKQLIEQSFYCFLILGDAYSKAHPLFKTAAITIFSLFLILLMHIVKPSII